MIKQGADGLSRGVWISLWHERVPTQKLLSLILSSVILLPGWHAWMTSHFILLSHLSATVIDWSMDWDPDQVLDLATTWIPPPEMASQSISFVLNTWVERPTTTSAVFIVPRVLSQSWQYLSHHVQTLQVLDVGVCPFLQHLVPVVILSLCAVIVAYPLPPLLAWTHLPFPTTDVFSRRPMSCTGCCHQIHHSDKRLICHFASMPWCFSSNLWAIPCGTQYHLECMRIGIPFVTCLPNNKSLILPKLQYFLGFICKACMVQSVLD